jgi:murein L,D-transpeptidase YafK
VIVRDSATRKAIRDTADFALPPNGGDLLDLVVTKSRYRLDIFIEGRLLKTYPVALGDAPEGSKQAQGDERTPEGRYPLIPHHPSPSFGGCFYVCYPNREDADRGLAAGSIDQRQHARIAESLVGGSRPPHDTALGGLILLHGTKDRSGMPLTTINWTNGCIAMENNHLVELLSAFEPHDRPFLEIRP